MGDWAVREHFLPGASPFRLLRPRDAGLARPQRDPVRRLFRTGKVIRVTQPDTGSVDRPIARTRVPSNVAPRVVLWEILMPAAAVQATARLLRSCTIAFSLSASARRAVSSDGSTASSSRTSARSLR